MKDVRGLIADWLVYLAARIYAKDDLKYSLAQWCMANMGKRHSPKKEPQSPEGKGKLI